MKKRTNSDNMFDLDNSEGNDRLPGLQAADEKRLRGIIDREAAARDRSNDTFVPFSRILSEIQSRKQKQHTSRLRFAVPAAGIAALLIAGIALSRFHPGASGEVIVFAGTVQKNGTPCDVKIFDRIEGGSVISASKRLVLRYESFALVDVGANASVKLDGSSFRNGRGTVAAISGETRFHVRRRSERDFFTVTIGSNRSRGVAVLGTVFSVRTASENEFDVVCIEGAVRIFDGPATVAVVNAGNAIRYSKGVASPIRIPRDATLQELTAYPLDKKPGERAVIVDDMHTIALPTDMSSTEGVPPAVHKPKSQPLPVEKVEQALSSLNGRRVRIVTVDNEVLIGDLVAGMSDTFAIRTPVALVAIDKRKVQAITAEKQR